MTAPTEAAAAPAAKAAPTYIRTCPECCAEFEALAKDRKFCTDAHKTAFHNRNSTVGRGGLVALAQAWRMGRNCKGNSAEARAMRASAARAFADMCRMLDEANADDRVNGRQAKLDYVRGNNRRDGTLQPEETAKWHVAQDAKAAAKKAAVQ